MSLVSNSRDVLCWNARRDYDPSCWALRHKAPWVLYLADDAMMRYYEDPAAGEVSKTALNDYAGTYQLSPGVTMTVARQGDDLIDRRNNEDLLWKKVESTPTRGALDNL
jgi:hypothetical protein